MAFRQGHKSGGTPHCQSSKYLTTHLIAGIPPCGDLFAGPEATSAKP
jgi:hypothetical protein